MPHLHTKKEGVLITRQIWHLLCLPYVYLSVFIYLQGANVCKSIFFGPFQVYRAPIRQFFK